MKCLKCGYCCINYDVIIVKNPELGIIDGNLIHKKSGDKCPHLELIDNEYSCKIHDKLWYKATPCFDYGQVEVNNNCLCRVGEYIKNYDN